MTALAVEPLELDETAGAGSELVPAGPTKRLVRGMVAAGYDRSWLARRDKTREALS